MASPMFVHLLNTTIIPANADGVYEATTIDLARAREIVYDGMAHDGQVFSHIGHQATADILTMALEMSIAVDRTPWDGSGKAVVLQMAGRPPEGEILTVEEMEAAGYTWRTLVRIG